MCFITSCVHLVAINKQLKDIEMLKHLSKKQTSTIVKNISSAYDESLINLSINLVINNRHSAEYLCHMLSLSLNDEDIKNFSEEEY